MGKLRGRCSRVGCEEPGAFQPVLLLVPCSGYPTPVEMALGLVMCNDHAEEFDQANDFLSVHGWRVIQDKFTKVGLALPKRELTTVRMVPVKLVEVH